MADAMAVESQKRAKAAWDAGHFSRSVVPVYDVNGLPILAYDEFMRPETRYAKPRRAEPLVQANGRSHARL